MPQGHWRHRGIELQRSIRSIIVDFNHRIEKAISTARLAPYVAQTSSVEGGWALYRWNIELAAAVAPLVADLEVTLRNTINDQLSAHFGRTDWWAANSLQLDDVTNDMLTEVVQRYQKRIAKGTVGPGRVVADATLGVWVQLLSRGGHSALGRAIDYETRLWRPALRFGFSTGTFTPTGRPRRPARADVYHRAALFQRLRNRAAHHEPILNGIQPAGANTSVPLIDVWEQSVELLAWMCPDLADWHRRNGPLPVILRNRPRA